MTNPPQPHGWLSGTTLRAAGAALALAMLVPAVLATGSAQAQTTTQVAQAQTFTTLHSFDYTDGANPYAALVQATNGSLYGTTVSGGANGDGTVFKITPNGTLNSLHSFDEVDGGSPYDGPIQATNGNFYGTTQQGGANNNCAPYNGCGTVFKMTPSGTLTTLYSFCSQSSCTDGELPYAALVLAPNGDFYGTTQFGGANRYGTVFKITPSDTLTTLDNFNYTDGGQLEAALVQGADGNFYGTTIEGGAHGYGTVFKITPSGTLRTLYSFCSLSGAGNGDGAFQSGSSIVCPDGQNPWFGSLVQGTDGNFYGTTVYGGANNSCVFSGYTVGCGTVFKITPSGTLTTLYSFCSQSGCADGSEPYAGVVRATDGNFYGTTIEGGTGCSAPGCGTVFKITPSGKLTTLHSFDGTSGDYPQAGLVQDTNGNLYGTTAGGGAHGDGTVFSLSVGLRPFVETKPTSGKEGSKIGILGQGFSSSSVVKFGGTKATTIVLSGTTFITATVPAGALTGSVTVTTGTTTLTSPQTFKVTPTISSFAPPSGPVGTSVTIKGTGLKQTTKVTFDGKSATFAVNSDTEVTADVPAGATTGKIAVTTKGGSATSATSFTVN